ncbi:MAG: bifunctional UDP-N-acetylmuramoyl-tripeptide:D-alanyl-D-alanine ligase/alanine racemase [Chitinophagaceae bacterium]|nr:MAG: bifunctional UDP-N-acetylmuramoyl-tripeptide:D-alanyl-D-alanine ligase/alanine racemase [Chitinophagaceae bacterium]
MNDIIAIIGGSQPVPEPAVIEELATDSRKINLPQAALFFALSGPRQTGHEFINHAYEQGVKFFVIKQPVDATQYPHAHFMVVPNVLAALQQLASAHRHQFSYPVIGITGSNGKTIVKEWLFQLLSSEYNIVRNPKSYNSQVGVPLSVWQMHARNTLAIFEAGISQPGEMQKLQTIIDPETGIFTFAGEAHAEGFSNKQEKISEKLQLFKKSKTLFYCADEKELDAQVKIFKQAVNPGVQLKAWGKEAGNFLQVAQITIEQGGTNLHCMLLGKPHQFFIPFTDEASLHNGITCIAVMCYFNIPAAQIQERLLMLRKVEMRLELKQAINSCSIINDSYSADLNSLGIALNFLEQQKHHERRTIILSDFLESGLQEDVLYQKIASMLQQRNLYRLIGIGEAISRNGHLFTGICDKHFYPTIDLFLQGIPNISFFEETILLKGARLFQFEKISKRLEQKLHQTFLEIDLNALRHNIGIYRNLLQPGVKMMCMVKALSYGSGTFEIASLLQHAGIDYLGVAYADEGVELRKAGITLPIMVMNTEAAGFENMVQYNLEPELYSFKILNDFKTFIQQQQLTNYPIHIKVDTGMNRLGFEPEEVEQVAILLQGSDAFKVLSVFSHLAGGGEAEHDAFTLQQGKLLQQAADTMEQKLSYGFLRHIANTGGIGRHPHLQMNMVRLGIGMYGVDANEAMQARLKNVTTLKTSISQIKHIKKGESVGYSRMAVATADTVIATVRIGYADGYPRLLSNGVGAMLVHGKLAPVMGRVCMDMTMIDITGIEAAEEDEVIVFGEGLPVHQLAAWAQTIEYEILTGISARVKRVYYEE